ncbi:hypothetical protein R5W23_005663 [Gemmata sp. JC673]|uniref:Uncharacterized protein n=1 Tax=Gemmata algarum TaxID=2975278 RepID=A0ABU5ET89_9BACT|nr:hypothetical protein [Gemmata algarum]MDY3558543.1 hypothetical protein [Gemmata algarum]
MFRIAIRGYACVCSPGPHEDPWQVVTDPDILRTLDGLVADDETFTDYLGPGGLHPTPEELELAAVLEPGGGITFGHRPGEPLLTATTEYRSPRPLAPAELRALVEYTMGQWSDGIGDNLFQNSIHPVYSLECLWSREVVLSRCPGAHVGAEYPTVEVTEE